MSDSKADFMRRAHHLAIVIYPKILCITRDVHGKKNITVDGFNCRYISWPRRTQPYRIVLSCELLTWITMDGRIPSSLTDFITTQELSGPFYVSPDIYHTQITEYSLMTFHE